MNARRVPGAHLPWSGPHRPWSGAGRAFGGAAGAGSSIASLVCVLFCAALLGCAGEDGGGVRPLRVGDRAPAYGARSLAGDSVDLADLAGRPVLVNVWATWCGPCRAEMPELQELAERYAGELHVLGVSIDGAGAGEEIRRFVDELGVDFPILHDARQRVVRRFTTIGVPESFLIDGEGIVRKRWTGRFRPLDPETLSLVDGLVGRDVSRARW